MFGGATDCACASPTTLTAANTLKLRGPADIDYPEKIARLLWDAQPTQNLWRKPIAGMFELVAELKAQNVAVGIDPLTLLAGDRRTR